MTASVPGITEADLKKVILALQQVAAGRSNAVITVTLTANAAATVVSRAGGKFTQEGIVAPGSVPIPSATTANAAAELGNGTLYHTAIGIDTFTINHANNAQTDRIFLYAIHG